MDEQHPLSGCGITNEINKSKVPLVRTPRERNVLQFSPFAGLEDGVASPRGRFCRVMTKVSGCNSPQNFQKVTSTDLHHLGSSDSQDSASRLRSDLVITLSSHSDEDTRTTEDESFPSLTEIKNVISKPVDATAERDSAELMNPPSSTSKPTGPSSLRRKLISLAFGNPRVAAEQPPACNNETTAAPKQELSADLLADSIRNGSQPRFADRTPDMQGGRLGRGQPRLGRDQPRLERNSGIPDDWANESPTDCTDIETSETAAWSEASPRVPSRHSTDGIPRALRRAWKTPYRNSLDGRVAGGLKTTRSTGNLIGESGLDGGECGASVDGSGRPEGLNRAHVLERMLQGPGEGEPSILEKPGSVRELMGIKKRDKDWEGWPLTRRNTFFGRREDKRGLGTLQSQNNAWPASIFGSIKAVRLGPRGDQNGRPTAPGAPKAKEWDKTISESS